jgi:hypothetical protein
MSLTFTGTGGLFTRLGRFGKVAYDMRTYQGTTLPANITSLMAQFDGLRVPVADIPAADVASRKSLSAIMSTLQTDAAATVVAMVKADKPAAASSLYTSLKEVIAQMVTAGDSVKAATVAATAAAVSGNTGTGVLVVSTKRGDGKVQENIIPEVAYVTCTADSQTGGATEGRETFQYVGEVVQSDVWAEDYPIGSGATTTLTAVDASQDAGDNLLTNSDFESFTSNLPDGWYAHAGVAGTDFKKSTTVYLGDAGIASLELVGGGTAPSLSQRFNNSGGTTATLLPSQSYAVQFWSKYDVDPAAGVITVELVGGASEASLSVLNDDAGTANSFTLTPHTQLTTTFASVTGVFRTPKNLPAVVRLRFRVSTGISSGTSVFIDRLAITPLVALYPGGPGAAVFSGATHFITNDAFTITTTNNYGGASNLGSFQILFERLFDMSGLGLLLPSASSPTIADSLVSS